MTKFFVIAIIFIGVVFDVSASVYLYHLLKENDQKRIEQLHHKRT